MPSTTKPSVKKKDGEQRNLWSAQHTPTYNETEKGEEERKSQDYFARPSLLSGKKGIQSPKVVVGW